MIMVRLCGLPWVMWNKQTWGEVCGEAQGNYLPVNPGVSWVPSHLVTYWLPGDAGPLWWFLSLHRWTDESLVLSQGDLSVCPVWGRPAAWLEEESRISTNSSCDQTGSWLLQQNGNRYCSAWGDGPEDAVFPLSVYFYLIASKAVTVWDWWGVGWGRAGWCRNHV